MNSVCYSTASSKGVLLVTNKLQKSPAGGRELLCRLNHDALKDIFGQQFTVVELPRKRLSGIREYLNAFRGYIDGLNKIAMEEAIQAIRKARVSKVFVDGSNLGAFVALAKREFPDIEIITFFHNVEARFFYGSLRQRKSIHALAVLIANYLAERKSVKNSDKLVCLSERDSMQLAKLYGRAATHISAMAVEDKLPPQENGLREATEEKFALFVGGGFYANRAGIVWFVEHVAPRIGVKIYVVGRGMEDIKPQLKQAANVVVIGSVEDLSLWYGKATFVIAPIFDGSGMKTKVAEALMFGKKIVGTPEAFSGYENVAEHAGWVCTTADEFVAAIGCADNTIIEPFDLSLRTIYEEKYSYPAARARLATILGEVS